MPAPFRCMLVFPVCFLKYSQVIFHQSSYAIQSKLNSAEAGFESFTLFLDSEFEFWKWNEKETNLIFSIYLFPFRWIRLFKKILVIFL